MTTMFKTKIVKEITVYTLALCLFVNTGLAGIIAYNQLKTDEQKSKAINLAKSIQTKPVSDKLAVDVKQTVNNRPVINQAVNTVVNNKITNEANYVKSTKQTGGAQTKTSQWMMPISADQYQILVRIIHAEANGEPFEGQVAVAAVLLNRIRSGKFPSSISANVFRNGEFESVSNGYIWEINPNASSHKAATLALKGWDPTAGSLYFFNPAKSTSRWIWSRPIYTIIGRHYFAG